MDEQNVHHFWGISPALDLGSLLPSTDGAADMPVDQPIRILQVAPYDARHTLATICRASRHPLLERQQQPVWLYVWEDSPEGLARHLLLVALLLDGGLVGRERGQLLLELHGNALLRQRAAEVLDEKARQLEALVVAAAAGGGAPGAAAGQPGPDDLRGLGTLAGMLDLSMLKFQERDALVEALQRWRSGGAAYDMVKAWDARCRKWYGERYDFRRNMVDWDYHMRLQPAGTPGADPSAGSIIHFHHFRHWRAHGVAHELRDAHYNQPNRSLLSTAYGRTREFKDRQLRDVGRSVSAWGFWADILNGPYHCFGTLTEEPSFYKVTNKQFARTAVDVAEHNMEALLHELRTGRRLVLAEGGEAHRARVARGPTSLEDLAGGAEAAAAAPATAANAAAPAERLEHQQQPGASSDAAREEERQSGAGEAGAGPGPAEAGREAQQQEQQPDEQQQSEQQREGLPTYTSGGRAQVAKAMAAAAAAAGGAPASEADAAPSAGGADSGGADPAAAVAGSSGPGPAPPSASAPLPAHGDAALQRMAAEEAALRAAEAALDAAGRARAARFRLVLLTGDLAKGVTGRPKFGGAFSALSLGHRHVHMLGGEGGLARAAAPGALLVAENARHVLQLSREQAELFAAKMDEMAAQAGWAKLAERPAGVTEASQVYRRPAAAAAAGRGDASSLGGR